MPRPGRGGGGVRFPGKLQDAYVAQGERLFLDAGQRLDACLKYLNADPSYKIRHIYMVWLQGESDTSAKKTPEDYEEKLNRAV